MNKRWLTASHSTARTYALPVVGACALLCGTITGPVFGEERAVRTTAIEEIVVTAQKREQRLQDVAAAVSSLSGDDFDVLNISNPFDFSEQVPGLVATNVQGYRRTFAIRGIGNELPDNAATKPGVAYHIDGIFMSNDFALFQDLVDVERVEVMRGPDGTIYGNSSSGGAINVISERPEIDSAFGFFDAEVGNYSTTNLRGSFNLPIADTVALRLSASQRDRDGFTKNVPNPQASPLNVLGAFNDLDDENNTSLNAQLLWQPIEELSALLSVRDFDMDINGPALKGGFDLVSSDPRVVSHDTTEFFEVDNTLTSLILEWQGPAFDVKGLFSRQEYKMSRRLDADRSSLTANDPAPLPVPESGGITQLGQLPIREHVGGLTQEDETWTSEVNLSSSGNSGSPFTWLLGAFYLDTEVESNTRNFVDNDRDGLPVNTSVVGFANPDTDFQNSDIRAFESVAVFGHLSYTLTDRITLTGGARWTENKFEDQRCNIFSGCLTNEGRVGTPARPSETQDNVTYKLALDYAWRTDNMLYASVATGIKPAASNNGFVEDPNDVGFFPEIFEEEEVTAWELGSKNYFLDRRLQINAAAYYYDIENYLFNSAGLNLTGNGVSGGSNLPESEVYGVEIESLARLSERFTLNVMLSAAESEIKEGRLAINRAEQVNLTAGLTDPAEIEATIRGLAEDLTGNELPKIPEVVANVRLVWDQPIDAGDVAGGLVTSLTWAHRGEYYNRVFNSERDLVDSYDLVHLNFQYYPQGSNWEFELNIQNLFDSDEVSSVHTDDFFQGVTSFQLLPPRLVTLRARLQF